MTNVVRFMIFLISTLILMQCTEDLAQPDFSNAESIIYDQILQDYDPPQYKWGYINTDGLLVIPDKYDALRDFSEGKAAYSIGGVWGYLDREGSESIPARYLTAQQFSEGRAVVQDLLGKYHILNHKGQVVADSLMYERIDKYHSGRARVTDGQRYGYIDANGQVIIDLSYEDATDFIDGYAIVTLDGKQGMIDTTNTIHIELDYNQLWPIQDGFIRYKQEGRYGFINAETLTRTADSYLTATDYHGGHAVVSDGDKYYLLSQKGRTTTLPYTFVDVGGEGKWTYAANARWGFLDNTGKVLCPPQYDLLMRYRDGRAGFALGESWGYLDESAEIVIAPSYPLVWDFIDGYARMIGRTGFGFMDRNGNHILPAQYMEVRDFSEGLARIQVYR